jgi:hypothetical protein
MRRALRKQRCKLSKVKPMAPLEPRLADLMLLPVVERTKADDPLVGRLQADPAIGSTADVSTFDWNLVTLRHAAVMPAYPRAVGGAGSRIRLFTTPFEPLRERLAKHGPAPVL